MLYTCHVIDLGECHYLAFAISNDQDADGQPLECRVLRLMAAEPEYKVVRAYAIRGVDVDRVIIYPAVGLYAIPDSREVVIVDGKAYEVDARTGAPVGFDAETGVRGVRHGGEPEAYDVWSDEADDELDDVNEAAGVNGDDRVVSIADVVNAALDTHYESMTDTVYNSQFGQLALDDLGFGDKTRTYRDAIDNLSGRFMPFQGALEVPKEVAAGYRAVADMHHRFERVSKEMRAMQFEFLVGLLTALDPVSAARTTTLGRLRELGLRDREPFSYDDY